MSHQNVSGPSVPVPPTQFNLGNGLGNLPSDFVLSSRDLGRLNPGLSESCNFDLQASPSQFKVYYHRDRNSPLFYFSRVNFYRQEKINGQSYCAINPRLERNFGHFGRTAQLDSYSNGQDYSQNDFMKSVLGFSGFSPVIGQVIMPRGDGRKVILPSQMSTVQAIELDPNRSHTRHFHNHFTSVLGHSANETVIDWQVKSLINVLKLVESNFGKPSGGMSFEDAEFSLEVFHQELIMLELLVSGSGNIQDKPMQVREYWEMLKCAYQVELGWPFQEDRFDGQMEYKIHFFPDAIGGIVRFDKLFPYYIGDPYDRISEEESNGESVASTHPSTSSE